MAAKLEAQGLLRGQAPYFASKLLVICGLFGFALYLAVTLQSHWWILGVAALLGFLSVQVELLGHDIGHRQTLPGARSGDVAGILLGNLALGVSYSYWIRKHNQHHAHPNHPTKDPDGDYSVLAMTPSQIRTRKRFVRPLVAIQAYLFLAWLPLQPVLMRIAGVKHIRHGHSRHATSELLLLAGHVAWYGFLLVHLGRWDWALEFFAIQQGIMGLYNGLVFAPNHKGMAIVGDSSSQGFLSDQVRTARNIRGHPVVDFCFGGLNYQVEHHLFPRLPRNRLSAAQPFVRRFCAIQGIPYHETSLWGSYAELFQHLHRTSAPLRRRRRGRMGALKAQPGSTLP